jgi:hypothetical protein
MTKPPPRRPDARGPAAPANSKTYAAPTPRVSRQKKAKVLTFAERAAFIASRPDLKPKG